MTPAEIREEVLDILSDIAPDEDLSNLKDDVQSWILKPDGDYERLTPSDPARPFSAHQYFMTNPSLSGRGRKVKTKPEALRYVRPGK